MSDMVVGRINGRWDLWLPDFRAAFHAERPDWEAGRLAHMAERVKPGMVVLDVGAEHGDFTALYRSWVGTSGAVVPVEPSPPMWPCIRATWDANGWEPPPVCFVGFASDVTSGIEHGWHEGWPTETAGEVVADPGFRHLAEHKTLIAQVRLDDLPCPHGMMTPLSRRPAWPDAVVLDVEGAEWNALSGLGRMVKRPLVWVSVHDVGDETWPGALPGWYGHTAGDLEDLMVHRGYRPGVELPSHGEGERFLFYEPEDR